MSIRRRTRSKPMRDQLARGLGLMALLAGISWGLTVVPQLRRYLRIRSM